MNNKAGAPKTYYELYLESMWGFCRKSVCGRVFSQTAKIQEITNSVFFLSSFTYTMKIKYGTDNIDCSEI